MSVSRAAKAYEDFRGFPADEIIEDYLPDNTQHGWHMGEVSAIEYDTYRDDEKQYYRHKFKPGAMPSLVAANNGEQLLLTGGKYRVTDRGIEDFKNMPALLIANPHKRGTKGKKVASAPARKRRKKRAVSRSSNPIQKVAPMAKRRRKARRAPARRSQTIIVRAPNPVKRLRRKARRSNPAPAVRTRRSVARRRRNPIGGRGGRGNLNLGALFLPALAQGAGAVATSVVTSYLPIPENLKSGSLQGATKAVVGLGLGWAVAKFFNKSLGQNIASGALTIALYDAVKGAAGTAGLPMNGMYPPSLNGMYEPSLGFTTAAAMSPGFATHPQYV